MKKLFVTLFVALCATATFAQSSLLATLSHEGKITSYYGTNALKEAYNAAANGDVITLSPGQFKAVNIGKAITVRGAGMSIDSISGSPLTVIAGDFTLSAPKDSTEEKLILEGLYHNHTMYYNNIKNTEIIKCRLNKVTYNDYNNKGMLMTFIQSRVNNQLTLASNSNMTCINSYICNPYSYNSSTSNFEMMNCVIYFKNYLFSSVFSNCIFIPSSTSGISNGGYLDSSNMAYNCIAVGDKLYQSGVFSKIQNSSNKQIAGYDMFTTFKGTLNDNADFILTESASKTYLGTDGTQVGIYGGMMPYETTPNNPQITKFNVASKSTADGKLSVDIQVSVAE